MNRYIVTSFFKTDRGEWHQPGKSVMFDEDEAEKYLKKNFIKAYHTQMIEPPETRTLEAVGKKRGRKRKNENNII